MQKQLYNESYKVTYPKPESHPVMIATFELFTDFFCLKLHMANKAPVPKAV